MEKYTDLEQAIRDSSLVIITEDITEKKNSTKSISNTKPFQINGNDSPTITQMNS